MARRLQTFADGVSLDAANLDATFLADLASYTAVKRASGSSGFTLYPGDGGLQRVGVVVNAAPLTRYVLDSAHDWRDRLIMVTVLVGRGASPAYGGVPGQDIDLRYRPQLCSRVAYTYQGGDVIDVTVDVADLHIGADGTDGYLYVERDGADEDTLPYTVIVFAEATERLGKRIGAPPAISSITATNGARISPHQLNRVQDFGLMSQVGSWRGDGTALPDSQAMPLGPITIGNLPLPYSRKTAKPGTRTLIDTRQRVAGGIPARWFDATITNAAKVVVLDDAHDWRDRLLFGDGRFANNTDIRPVTGTAMASATMWSTAHGTDGGACYTGSGEDGTAFIVGTRAATFESYYFIVNESNPEIRIYARDTDGALMIDTTESLDTDVYRVVGWVAASFQLGPRS